VPEAFVEMLSGGHPNSLGRTEEVLGLVLADGSRLEQLFDCLDEPDAIVRMRAGDALNDSMQTQAAQVIAHPTGGDLRLVQPQALRK